MLRRAFLLALAAAVLLPAVRADAIGGRGAAWQFLGIGPSHRTVRILVERSPCLSPNLQLRQEPQEVSIGFWPGPPPGPECPPPTYEPLTIRLDAPLAGRPMLSGNNGLVLVPRPPGTRAPNVVGLASRDGIAVLQGNGFRPTVIERRKARGLRRVLAQRGGRLVLSRP